MIEGFLVLLTGIVAVGFAVEILPERWETVKRWCFFTGVVLVAAHASTYILGG